MFGRNKSKPQVLVVGAGPVGLYAALYLARAGVRVQVIDEEWRGTLRSYALALHPGSIQLLDEMDLGVALLRKSHLLNSVGFFNESGRRAGLNFKSLSVKYPFLAIVPQAELEELLLGALKKQHVEVLYNHRLARFSQDDSAVHATVDTLDQVGTGYGAAGASMVVSKSTELELPLMFAADGHDSLVRRQLGIAFDDVQPPEHFAVFEFEGKGNLPDEVCVMLERDTTDVLWPMGNGRYRWSFSLTDDIAPPASRNKDRVGVTLGGHVYPHLEPEYLKRFISERAPWFDAQIDTIDWRIQVRFEHRIAQHFGAGRVWLAGDAAHMAGPVGVHSMNIGLREARDLSEVFIGMVHGEPGKAALQHYEQQREQEWKALLGIEHSPIAQANTDPWVAENIKRLLPCIPASGQALDELLQQLALPPLRVVEQR